MSHLMATYALLAETEGAPERARRFVRLTQYLAEVGTKELELPEIPIVDLHQLLQAMLVDLRFLRNVLSRNLTVTVSRSPSRAESEAIAWAAARDIEELIKELEQASSWSGAANT